MTRTIVRLFDDRKDALEAAHELERMGIPDDDVSIVASNKDNWFDGERVGDGAQGDGKRDKDGDGRDDRAEGATKGAVTGGALGAGAGLLAGLGLLAIPGLGPVVAAGWLAATAAGAAAGAVAGGALGGLGAALTSAGVSEEDAHIYSEGVKRGGTLLSVRVDEDRAMTVESAIDGFRAVDIRDRGQEYRESGWSSFESEARS
jgi:hypothetical protein